MYFIFDERKNFVSIKVSFPDKKHIEDRNCNTNCPYKKSTAKNKCDFCYKQIMNSRQKDFFIDPACIGESILSERDIWRIIYTCDVFNYEHGKSIAYDVTVNVIADFVYSEKLVKKKINIEITVCYIEKEKGVRDLLDWRFTDFNEISCINSIHSPKIRARYKDSKEEILSTTPICTDIIDEDMIRHSMDSVYKAKYRSFTDNVYSKAIFGIVDGKPTKSLLVGLLSTSNS